MLSNLLHAFAQRIPTPGTQAPDVGIPSEAHHVHLAATVLAGGGLHPVLEVYYDNPWTDEQGKERWGRADLWAPPPDQNGEEVFLEAKLALLYDATTARLGSSRYGLVRAAPDWAWDIYRLLIGPARATNCAFLLVCFSAGGQHLFQNVPTGASATPILAAGQVDADQIYARVAALGGLGSSLDALRDLASIVLTDLHGKVSRLGGPVQVGNHWADPFLFEWRQAGPATTT